MATDLRSDVRSDASATSHDSASGSVTGLVTGIVNDLQDLVKQHVDLLRQEVREDFQKSKEAAGSMILGAGIAGVGGLLLTFMLVHLLHWAWPALLLWHAFAIVGGAFAVVGGILVVVGRKRFATFNPLPDKTMREIQWTVKPK
jgi:hypothetical protein